MIAVQHAQPRVMTVEIDARAVFRSRLDHFLKSIERRALRMAQLAVGDRDDALELVQDSMFGFVKSYAEKPETDWPPLFWRVLDSRIQDHHRRQSVRNRWRVFLSGNPAEPDQDQFDIADPHAREPAAVQQGAQAAQAIHQALRLLPDRQRQAFLLRMWEGFDVAATAQVMGCSEGSVKTHLFRAMDALKKRLEGHR